MTKYTRESPSPRYRELLAAHASLHQRADLREAVSPATTFSGTSVLEHVARIGRLIAETGAATILDYGSGKGLQYGPLRLECAGGEWPSVQRFWGVEEIRCYDPGHEPFQMLPDTRFDGVVSTDVLEHCPQEDVTWILDEMFGLARRFVYLGIACHPATRRLPNGQNAHSTIRPPEWWSRVLEDVSRRHAGVSWEAWLRTELRSARDRAAREERLANFPALGDPGEERPFEVTLQVRGESKPWKRSFGGRAPEEPRPAEGLRGQLLDFYWEFGGVYTFRRIVHSTAFMCGPLYAWLTRPFVRAYYRVAADGPLRRLLEGRRVLVLGSGPSAGEVPSIPDDVLILTTKLGPEILEDRGLRRRIDLYYYSNIREDRAGRERRLHIDALLRRMRIGVFICEDFFSLLDVRGLKDAYEQRLMDFGGSQVLLREVIAPIRIEDIRGDSFCPWTSSGVRLIQYALHYGASEIYLAGIDLGENHYASGRKMRRWDHQDIDRNFLELISKRHDNVYTISRTSPITRFFPTRLWDERSEQPEHAPAIGDDGPASR